MNTRICSKCHEEKDISEYSKQKSNIDGLRKLCKFCCKEYAKKYREKNRVVINEYNKKWRENNIGYKKQYTKNNKDKIIEYRNKMSEYYIEYARQYYKDNREYIIEKTKKYYENNVEHKLKYDKKYREFNKEVIKERNRKYSKENRNKCNVNGQKYRSKKKQLPSTLTLDQWNKCKEYFNNKCCYCGEEKPLEQEHFIPLSKGGEYTHKNIISACKSCNSGKGNKSFDEWYPKQSCYSKERELKIIEYLCQVKLKST